MKIIAVLTTLFLPGTFVAVSDSKEKTATSATNPIDNLRHAVVQLGSPIDSPRFNPPFLGLLGCDYTFDICDYGFCVVLGNLA